MTSNGKTPTDVVILSGARTPIGRFNGALAGVDAPHLGGVAIKAAVERAGIDPAEIEEVLMGQVVAAGSGQAPGRRAAIYAGLPVEVGASSVNKACGSGLKAVMFAAQAIRAGDADLIVAGGMENMSAAPYLVRARQGFKFGHQQLEDSVIVDGLWCSFENWIMGNAAEFIADEYEVTRAQMDEFALASHQKAIAAMEACRFKVEIAPVEIAGGQAGKGAGEKVTVIETDEGPRRDTSIDALSRLKPAFKKDGKVTAGNAPGLNDGGAAVVVASRRKAEQIGKAPLARIVGYAQAAVEPKWLFIAPARAIPKLLDKIGWTLKDVDLIEINEAFAAQVLADGRALMDRGWDWGKVNVNGGAIALGHPVGASGARVLVTLMHALKDRGLKRGIATLCLGGGEAVALAVEAE
ncbi:MAG: acetyl-CoA C-acetyltransferase [Chloroflexi bacterium]|nr:acetyl-CoA C-acetyltransferase [Chloroflexota bacterium]